jgi:hypothetical protein
MNDDFDLPEDLTTSRANRTYATRCHWRRSLCTETIFNETFSVYGIQTLFTEREMQLITICVVHGEWSTTVLVFLP